MAWNSSPAAPSPPSPSVHEGSNNRTRSLTLLQAFLGLSLLVGSRGWAW
jgi:hypothetical protein